MERRAQVECVAGPDRKDVALSMYAVSEDGTILHYDGNVWTPMVSGTGDLHNSIFGFSEADVFRKISFPHAYVLCGAVAGPVGAEGTKRQHCG